MTDSTHPLYQTWKYHRKNERFPWKTNFKAFAAWTVWAGYNPKQGDQIKQGHFEDRNGPFYKVWVTKPDGSDGGSTYIVRSSLAGDSGGQYIFSAAIEDNLQRLYRSAVKLADGRIILCRDNWLRLAKHLGMDEGKLDKSFPLPIEFSSADSDTVEEDFLSDQIREVFTRMHASCYNTKSAAYSLVGAKGIKVVEEWHDFEKFRSWAKPFVPISARQLSLVRSDKHSAYGPYNCRLL